MPDSAPEPDPESCLRLLAAHERSLAGYVHSLVNSTADAEDILQECKVVMWRQFAKFEPGANFLAWARKIPLHQILNVRRKETRRMTSPVDQAFIESVAADDWSEADLLLGRAPEIETGRKLGEFTIRRGAASAQVEFSTPELTDFIREDSNHLATFAIIRETGESDRQGLVHAFASREHPSARPPILRLQTP